MSTNSCQVVFDSWDSYVSGSDEQLLFVSFDVEAARQDLTDTLTHCARVMIPIHHPNDKGGPVRPESERLYGMEDELCGSLAKHGVVCRLVGRLTCGGVRELVFQLEDWQNFRPLVARWAMSHREYQIGVAEDEGWVFFDDCIRPTPEIWLMMSDQSVLRVLREAGSNPEKVHALDFVFCGDEYGLRRAAQGLEQRGYLEGTMNFGEGQIVMVKRMLLDEEAILAESQDLLKLAEEYGIHYDGWGAAVVR